MNQDPWRLPTEAVSRATGRCFRLPALDVPGSFDALDDPETLLERLFGQYLPGSDAPRDGHVAMGNGSAPRTFGPNAKPAWAPAAVADATRLPRTTARQDPPPETASSAGLASVWRTGARPSDSAVAAESPEVVAAARPASDLPAGRGHAEADMPVASRAATLSGETSVAAPTVGSGQPWVPPRRNAGPRTTPADLAPTAPTVAAAPNVEVTPTATPGVEQASAGGAVAASLPPGADQAGGRAGITATSTGVTRLGRGAAQLAAVLRAGTATGPADQAPVSAVSPSQAGLPATSATAELADPQQIEPAARPVDPAVVATIAEEVAGRLRDELEWEFQRTYGLGW